MDNKFDPTKKLITKETTSNIKEGVDFVFEQNQELEKIGTKEQYSGYLDTVFPESAIKDISYHEGNKGIEEFSTKFFNDRKGGEIRGRYGIGHYFTPVKWYATGFGEQMYSVLLNTKNPKIVKYEQFGKGYDYVGRVSPDAYQELKRKGFDSLIGSTDIEEEKDAYPMEYVVFEPEQIHILGSRSDIEGFKKFVESNNLQ